jgi:2-dehydropantoate 2-reductase
MDIDQIAIIGAGSLGSLIGGLLSATQAVTLVGRDPHMRTVAEDGLQITGTADRRVHPETRTTTAGLTADLAVVSVKSYDTAAVTRALGDADVGVVLTVQNGIANAQTLREHLSVPVLAGTTTMGATLRAPGRVAWLGTGAIHLGPADAPEAAAVASTLAGAGIETHLIDDVQRMLWRKLAINVAINPLTAVADVPNGMLRDRPLWSIASTATAEAVRVGRTVGIRLEQAATQRALWEVLERTAGNTSSMRADVRAGRRTEADALTGHILRVAAETDTPVPVTSRLDAAVRHHAHT